jgi:hypothetical protein
MSIWLTLRRQLVFFLLGLLLGALIVASAMPEKSAELQMLELDVTRNGEKIVDLQRQVGALNEWVLAHDRQAIHDGELQGESRAKTDAHEKLTWLIGAATLGLLGELALRRARRT